MKISTNKLECADYAECSEDAAFEWVLIFIGTTFTIYSAWYWFGTLLNFPTVQILHYKALIASAIISKFKVYFQTFINAIWSKM